MIYETRRPVLANALTVGSRVARVAATCCSAALELRLGGANVGPMLNRLRYRAASVVSTTTGAVSESVKMIC
jgi:hypothetical protein